MLLMALALSESSDQELPAACASISASDNNPSINTFFFILFFLFIIDVAKLLQIEHSAVF